MQVQYFTKLQILFKLEQKSRQKTWRRQYIRPQVRRPDREMQVLEYLDDLQVASLGIYHHYVARRRFALIATLSWEEWYIACCPYLPCSLI